ncbi:hypothetical protein TBS_23920 [Thermobispora bispora]|uniref:Uncharacterized protein n=1 Tax=Thermobispora bispora (strain ATCC 19993 / DSM 43833 / CBS 139.67 / JCM 10125 / KCTC 9307 / NBRC 14880 / R51) TaxID=469371 RepID=D6Y6L7_THEBD|nr:hypothetical protein [Thermobispora bispora]ADG87589.1 hypothetical protein Tbis_0865 [Thermobispora bispora DSM 43833]MBO2472926.1 hypothetical protein [Actinomycetales bacterium]MBX6167035.1 hypothetical protein [Thermobispora bispora]QSI47512.1 hypothetical protein CYL17_06260 [Thermobispora bispora]
MWITYPVPAETTSVFVVATDRVPAELSSLVPWRMGASPHRLAAKAALGTPRLALEAYPARRSPWRHRIGLADDDLGERVRRARHHIVVSSRAPVTAQPGAAQAARAVARAAAEAYGGVTVDPLVGSAVYHCPGCPGERREFRLGDDWLGWTAEPGATEPGAGAPVLTSRGLCRFGLPELTLDGMACAHTLCAAEVLRLAAERLLAGHLAWLAAHPGCRSRTVAGHLRIGEVGVAVLSAGSLRDGRPIRARLTPEAARRACLKVGDHGADTGDDRPGLGRLAA